MPWRNVRGHDAQVDSLRKILNMGRLPHAFLFVGPEGIGKQMFARTFAQALLCERATAEALEPCGACPGCAQVAAETHPDLLIAARPDDKHDLPIQSIRTLCHDLALKPARGGRRIAIIDDADHLNEEASNAFLKTLEEPPPGSVLILIGTGAELQLDTIVSRCRVLRFEPLDRADLAAILLDHGIALDSDDADRLAAFGQGSVRRAMTIADPTLAQFRKGMLEELADSQSFDAPGLARRLEAFCRESGKQSINHRDRACVLIGEVAGLLRGVLYQTAGLDPPCPDPDDRQFVEILSRRLDPEDVLVLAERCLEAEAQIRRMTNLGLVLEAWTRDLGRLIHV